MNPTQPNSFPINSRLIKALNSLAAYGTEFHTRVLNQVDQYYPDASRPKNCSGLASQWDYDKACCIQLRLEKELQHLQDNPVPTDSQTDATPQTTAQNPPTVANEQDKPANNPPESRQQPAEIPIQPAEIPIQPAENQNLPATNQPETSRPPTAPPRGPVSFLHRLSETDKQSILTWLSRHTPDEISRHLSQPKPDGLGVYISADSLRRFLRFHQRRAQREQNKRLSAEARDLLTHLPPDADFASASLRLIKARLLKATADPNLDLTQMAKITSTLNAIRLADHRCRSR